MLEKKAHEPNAYADKRHAGQRLSWKMLECHVDTLTHTRPTDLAFRYHVYTDIGNSEI